MAPVMVIPTKELKNLFQLAQYYQGKHSRTAILHRLLL